MIENESQLREIISQYNILVKRAEAIVHETETDDFAADYFDTDPRVLSDRSKADSYISICGTNRYNEYDHWDIPVAWLLLDDKELKVAIEEKNRQKEEEEKKAEEEEHRKWKPSRRQSRNALRKQKSELCYYDFLRNTV